MNAEKFNALPNNKKRVAIAKDVLSQLKAEKIIPKEGVYVNSDDIDEYLYQEKNYGKEFSLQKLLPKFKCAVSAKGALFLSDIRKRNQYNVNYGLSIGNTAITNKLDYFDESQLNLIEAAYEGFGRYGCRPFHDSFNNEDERLITIMNNIIKNDGEFILDQKFLDAEETYDL
jgi:hypothetical protein